MRLFSGSQPRRFFLLILTVFLIVLSFNFLVDISFHPTPKPYFPVERANAELYQTPDSFRSDPPPFGVLPCLKETYLDDLDWWGKQRFEGVTYFYLAGHNNGDVYPLVVTTSDHLSCELLFYDVAGHGLPLADLIPLSVARSLWRQRYSLFLADHGKDTLQKMVKARNAGVDVECLPEQRLALQDLEIKCHAK